MKVGELCDVYIERALAGRFDMTVHDAAIQMARVNHGCIVVMDDEDTLIGIVTERDILRKVVAAGRDPAAVILGQIMTGDPKTVTAASDVREAARLMDTYGFRHIPVVDEAGHYIGTVSMRDLVSFSLSDAARRAAHNVSRRIARGDAGTSLITGSLVVAAIVLLLLIFDINPLRLLTGG